MSSFPLTNSIIFQDVQFSDNFLSKTHQVDVPCEWSKESKADFKDSAEWRHLLRTDLLFQSISAVDVSMLASGCFRSLGYFGVSKLTTLPPPAITRSNWASQFHPFQRGKLGQNMSKPWYINATQMVPNQIVALPVILPKLMVISHHRS